MYLNKDQDWPALLLTEFGAGPIWSCIQMSEFIGV